MAHGLNEGDKFACIALQVPFVELELPTTLICGLHLWPNIEVDSEFWKKELGEWQLRYLEEATVIIAASAPSLKPTVLDEEHGKLLTLCWQFAQALLLNGARWNAPSANLKGSFFNGAKDFRSFYVGQMLMETDGQPYTIIDVNRIQNAELTLKGLLRTQQTFEDYRRFRKGVASFLKGMEERSCDDRAYYFVRALEALHATKPAEGKQKFVEKCQVFAGRTEDSNDFFADLFDVRNNVVHVNGFDALAKSGESLVEAEQRIVRQCADAEIIVKEVYRRILSDPVLHAHFLNDDSIRGYWASAPSWSPPVEPDAVRALRETELSASEKW